MQYEECCICLKNLDSNIKILPCKHIIHENCMIKMENSECCSKNKCPICREIIDKTIKPNKNGIPLPIVQLFMFANPFENNFRN